MAYQPKPNGGALFKNDRAFSDNDPQYKGQASFEQTGEHRVSGWLSRPKTGGDQYISLRFSPVNSKPNNGILFRNKAHGENDPVYSGHIHVENPGEHWVSAWINESNNGDKYMSLKISPKVNN